MTVTISTEALTTRKTSPRPTLANTITIGTASAAYIEILRTRKTHLIADVNSIKRIECVIDRNAF